MSKKYRISQFAERIGKSAQTLRRWDAEGRLLARRSASGQRYYDESDVRRALGIAPDKRKVVVYCRVSSQNQRNDLRSQETAMQTFCLGRGLAVDEWITEIGGGMNFKRKRFLTLMSEVSAGLISTLVVAHKDRLVRFGFDYFEHMAMENGCEIIVANQEQLSPQHEMVEDLMAIVHTFSCRLYGLRNYKKQIQEAAEGK